MCLFEGRKLSFLFCLAASVTVYSVIYLWTKTQIEPKLINSPSCRPFATECKAFLPGTEEGVEWHRQDCQVERFIVNNQLQCSNLTKDLHFITRPLSREEEDYPLAFIMTIHKEFELFVRVLRAIYMPQNVYCIHVDAKAPPEYQDAVRKIVGCFKNAFLSTQSESVTYGGFSRLQADVNCMKDLVGSSIGWRKVVNLCGQDFPISSNLELVQYMKSKNWRDRNMTPGVKQPGYMRYRTEFQHREITGSRVALKGWGMKKSLPPHNLQIYFGTAYYALTRAFVDFVLKSNISHDLLEWSKDTYSPDEHYWVTLNHIKEAPGSYIDGEWEGNVRAIKWSDQVGTVHDGCKGHYVRDICIFGVGDLPWIINQNQMFANKFDKTYPEALDCLEQWHRNKVLNQATVPIEPSWLLATQKNSSSRSFNSSAGA